MANKDYSVALVIEYSITAPSQAKAEAKAERYAERAMAALPIDVDDYRNEVNEE